MDIQLSLQEICDFFIQSSDIVYAHTSDGIITYANENIEKTIGYTIEEIKGRHFSEFIHPDDIEYAGKLFEKALLQNEHTENFRFRIRHKDGRFLHFDFKVHSIFKEGVYKGGIGIGRDITEKKKNEENLKLALMKERQNNELKQHFISMVSHEFRTPLFLISGTAELLENDTKAYSSDKIKKNFKAIKDNVKRLSKTLDDIVLLCSENHEEIFNPRALNIIDMCLTIVKEVCLDLKIEDRIKFSYCEKISQTKTYLIDYEIMRHILTNLLNNAVKYSAGSSNPVEFRVENIDSILKFTISDKGIGIPEAEIKNLFHTFMRASNASKVPGTGIGLALVKKFVDIHKGEIFIESAVNEGTKVYVNIPVKSK